MFLCIYDNRFCFYLCKGDSMDVHKQLLNSLCRICGEIIKAGQRREEAYKLADQIQQIWKVSVSADYRNVHPRYICIRCRAKCSNDHYLAGKFNPAARTWFPHSDECAVSVHETQGRPRRMSANKNQ